MSAAIVNIIETELVNRVRSIDSGSISFGAELSYLAAETDSNVSHNELLSTSFEVVDKQVNFKSLFHERREHERATLNRNLQIFEIKRDSEHSGGSFRELSLPQLAAEINAEVAAIDASHLRERGSKEMLQIEHDPELLHLLKMKSGNSKAAWSPDQGKPGLEGGRMKRVDSKGSLSSVESGDSEDRRSTSALLKLRESPYMNPILTSSPPPPPPPPPNPKSVQHTPDKRAMQEYNVMMRRNTYTSPEKSYASPENKIQYTSPDEKSSERERERERKYSRHKRRESKSKDRSHFSYSFGHQPMLPGMTVNVEGVAKMLRLRDLRRLDFAVSQNDGLSITVRRHVVLFTADPIRAVITSSRLILILPPGADSFLAVVEEYMKGSQAVLSMPFEMHAYEALFSTLNEICLQEISKDKDRTRKLIRQLLDSDFIAFSSEDEIRRLKNRVARLLERLTSYKNNLEALADDEETLALLNLSTLKANPGLYKYPLSNEILAMHEEMEESLEPYMIDFTNLLSALSYMKVQIHNAEEHVSIQLDVIENKTIVALNYVLIAISATHVGIVITGAFAMNLDLEEEDFPNSFAVVNAVSVALMVLTTVCLYWYMRHYGAIPD